MSKVAIKQISDASPIELSGGALQRRLFDQPADPIHVRLYELRRGARLTLANRTTDAALYVWKGAITAADVPLPAGSSLIAEHGAAIELTGSADVSQLVEFSASQPLRQPLPGGHLHLPPTDRVPRATLRGANTGALHADASCGSCRVWLHENSLHRDPAVANDTGTGIHSHSEDEAIFITAGEMCFGKLTLPAGTTVAIAANAYYSFRPGPDGLSFVNFRAGLPTLIKFKNGETMDEVAFWRSAVSRPEYIER